MKVFLLVILGLALLFCVMFYLGQARLIYFPRSYYAKAPELKQVDHVAYLSGGKKQWAYILKRNSAVSPERVWWLFGGNGSTALGWVDLVSAVNSELNQAFVLFDYPGYGFNRGKPHPDTIRQAVDDAIPAVAEELGLSKSDLTRKSRTMGHSLGCAVAFDTAHRHGMSRVVAVSPFTTMKAMAELTMGPVLSKFLSHHYDNETAIDALLERESGVEITIFHGESDTLIPLSMGLSLAERDASKERIEFIPVAGAGHNDIVSVIQAPLIEILSR